MYILKKVTDMHVKKSMIFGMLIVFIIFINTICFAAEEVRTYSPSIYMIEQESGKVIYDKASMEKMYPASATMIMTAIIVIENKDINDRIVITDSAMNAVPRGYVASSLKREEEISIDDLIRLMLIQSANDAGTVLAESVGGTISDFVIMMNNKASELRVY
jgi:D-alanyl-D-alanine carboxypeptidase